jgi:hypothetical protein
MYLNGCNRQFTNKMLLAKNSVTFNNDRFIIYVITRFFTSIKIKWNVQNGLQRQLSNHTINYISKLQMSGEILAYWKFKIGANGIQKTSSC